MLKWLGRNWLRLVALATFGTLAALGPFGGSENEVGTGWNLSWVLPRLSPILSMLGALGARQWAGWGVLLGVPLLVVSFFWGRVFCWRMCPMGFLAELAGKLNPWGRQNVRKVPASLGKLLALVIAVTAACGYPLFIWLDPLCIFNGFFAAWRNPLTVVTATTGIGFVTILVLSVAVPNVWCHRLCPLGGLQQAIMEFSRWLRARMGGTRSVASACSGVPGAMSTTMARRTLLGASAAAVGGLVAHKVLGPNSGKALRPPSADKTRFNSLCARCGNCMKACPYGLLHPDMGETGIDGLLTPVMRLRSKDADQEQFCFQDCTACTQVCPTGALRPLTVAEKHETAVGLAVVRKDLCVAWAKGEYCVVCDEYCPYKAVQLVKHGGVNCPVIDPQKCRGCGACESNCPADPIAIVVNAI